MLIEEKIEFGTDGWRSRIADGFTFDNVKRVAQASCEAIKRTTRNKLILVGYDNRFFSDRFAEVAARVAVGNGYKVEMSSGPVSSPLLSFQVHQKKAAMGFMLTASHNPFTFNGFKLKGPHGGSVDEEFTKKVEGFIDGMTISISPDGIKKGEFAPGYISNLKKLVKISSFSKIKGPVVFDSMYGPGANLCERLPIPKGKVIFLRKNRDPLFAGGAPEPVETNLSLLKETVLKNRASLGVAVDGDVDRIGVVDDKGNYLPPHTVMPLILLHLIENRKLKGKVIQTVSMGYLPGRIARHFKLPFEEVSVGFKHIAKKMGKEKVLFGGEESGGFGIGIWAPERDGLLCALLLMEMMAKQKKPISALVEDLYKRFGQSHFKRVDFNLEDPVIKSEWTQSITPHLTPTLTGQNVKQINTQDGIKIVLDDDSWVLMRPSGTEPLIRTYSEASSTTQVEQLLAEAHRLIHIMPTKSEIEKDLLKKKKKAKDKLAAKKKAGSKV